MSFDMRIDVDPVITCPYNKNHRIARSRIQKHLVKCEKNFPADYKQQCPYDATHRIFEHEMIEHVTHCKMKFTNPLPSESYNSRRLLVTEPEIDIKIESDENWDENNEDMIDNNPFQEPIFETINIKQYRHVGPTRGHSLMSRRDSSKLRRPFGFSESMMLDISDKIIEEDTLSLKSDLGIGRGQNLPTSTRGQYVRGRSRNYRRSLRGR